MRAQAYRTTKHHQQSKGVRNGRTKETAVPYLLAAAVREEGTVRNGCCSPIGNDGGEAR